jgi:hypothetical protein
MPTPSLILVPARFKSGKLYTQVATTTGGVALGSSGDFNVTRATTATRVNANGLIESVASGIPRLDYYTSGGTAGCPALLVEPQAQNLVPNGVGFTSSTGVQTSGITDSPAVAISGTVVTKNEASGTIRYLGQNFSASALASGTTYTVSRFFKYNGVAFNTSIEHNNAAQWGGVGWVQAVVLSAASGVTLGASTLCTGSIENFGNGWHRVNVRVTTGAAISGAATVAVLSILPAALSTGQGFLTACPQLEVGSVATSYIPTTSAAVTRNADVINLSGAVSGCIGQTQGTIYCEFAYFGQPVIRSGPIYLRQASLKGLSINSAPGEGIVFISRNDGGNTSLIVVSGALQIGTYYKIAVGYDAGGTAAGGSQASGVVAYVNGTQAAIGTFQVPDAAGLTEFRMYGGNAGIDTEAFNGRIRSAAIYTTRLTNAQLQALTTL